MTICELVSADIDARAKLGMKRYGKPLMPGNLFEALQNAYEEALDQAIYLKQALVTLENSPEAVRHREELADARRWAANLRNTPPVARKGTYTASEVSEEPGVPSKAPDAPESLLCVCGKELTSIAWFKRHKTICKGPKVPKKRGRPAKHKSLPIGSTCCSAPVKVGPRHVHGNRYCTACGLACTWSAGRLPPGANKNFHCRGMNDCPRLTEYKDGYCLPCWTKRRPKASPEEEEILNEIHSDSPDTDE